MTARANSSIQGISNVQQLYIDIGILNNYPDRAFVQETLAQLNWYINIAIMKKVKDLQAKLPTIEAIEGELEDE